MNLIDSIPESLQNQKRWVLWKRELASGRMTKIPYQPNGRKASSTHPPTWSLFAQVLQVTGGFDGIGFVLGGGFCGIDLDNHIDGGGVISEFAQDILSRFPTYAEISPSGRGIHLILHGEKIGDRAKKFQDTNDDGTEQAIEVYDSGRYFTVTGTRIGSHDVAHLQRQLNDLYDELFPPAAQVDRSRSAYAPVQAVPDDSKLIDKALSAKNGAKFAQLWEGDCENYQSSSEADLALCDMLAFWTRCDANAIDRIFRQSGLYREKWDRQDYRDRTINKAISGCREVYEGRQGKSLAKSETNQPEPTAGEKQHVENGLEIRYSDGWRAKRLVSLFGDDLRYCDEWGKWLIWDGKRFTIDRQLEILSYAKRTTADMLREAAKILEMGGDADTLIAEAKKSDSNAKYNAMISLARSEPNVPILAESVNRDQMLLNVANGTVNLTSGELLPFDRSNLITKLAPVNFDPDADCPLWTESLELFMDGRESLINFLQRAVGYAITGQISEQVLIILYGTGANGKSTFIETVLALLGEYAGQTEPDLLIMKRNENHPSGLADLMGRRFVATTEIGEGVRLNEPLVKRLTGGDRIKARFMREDWFEFAPTHKIFAAVNHEPTIRGTDNGIWRRIRLVPFDITIPEAKQVPFNMMMDRLKGEMSGILNWAIEGCRMWQEDGLGLPLEIKKATERYRLDMDVVGRFLDECCYLNAEMKAKAGDLYKAFCEWCEQCGEKTFSQKVFGGKLAEKGFTSVKGTGGYKFWDGLGISNHSADENDRDFL